MVGGHLRGEVSRAVAVPGARANSLNLTLLREEDYYRQHVDEATGAVLYELRVPRIKKRHAKYRTAFKVRKLNPEIGQKVAALIASNRARAARDGWPDPAYAKPIFVRRPQNRPLSRPATSNTRCISTASSFACS